MRFHGSPAIGGKTVSALRYARDAELLLIAEVSRRLTTTNSGDQESIESVMALLERQQQVAACRALDRPVDS